MIIQALIAILMLIVVVALAVAFLPVVGVTIGAIGSLIAGAAARVTETYYLLQRRRARRDASGLGSPTAIK